MTANQRSAPPRSFEVTAAISYRVTIHDPEVVRRAVENVDGWRESFYDLHTERDVVEHLAWNLGHHSTPLNQLDGWADLPPEAAEAELLNWDYETVEELN